MFQQNMRKFMQLITHKEGLKFGNWLVKNFDKKGDELVIQTGNKLVYRQLVADPS